MEALISEFTFLSDQALQDKNFDPSKIEDPMKLFDLEAYKAWSAVELEQEKEVKESENYMNEAEGYLDSVMESAMEFLRFEEEMNRVSKGEYESLVNVAEGARNMGNSLEKAATFASNMYIEAAVNSATASMKSAIKAISSNANKVGKTLCWESACQVRHRYSPNTLRHLLKLHHMHQNEKGKE